MSRFVAGVIYRWRWPLTLLIVAGAVLLAPRANVTRIDNDLTTWFSREDPIYREYERFQDEFGGTRTLIVAVRAPSRERLFSRDIFEALDRLTGEIERVETVERVVSLASATVVDARPAGPGEVGTLDVRPLVDDLRTASAEEVGRRALADPLLRGDLVSEDGTVAALAVFFDERRVDAVRAGVLDEIVGLVRATLPPDVEAFFNGSIEISETYNRVTLDNQLRFTPPIVLLTFLAIFGMFRSWRKTAVTFVAVLVSVLWTLGLYDLMGYTYNVLTSMIVPLIVVLGISDDVHMLQHYDEARRRGSAEEAFKAAVGHLLAPLFGASVTTALGMISLTTSAVVAVRSFGLGAAAGVMVDFAVSIVLVPTLLGLFRPDSALPPQKAWFFGPMMRVARFSTGHPRAIVIVTAAIAVAAAAGVTRLRVDTNHINFFSTDHPLSRSAAIIDEHLSGIYTFQVLLEGPPDSLSRPDALARMDRLAGRMRELPFVRKVTSLADYVRRLHEELGDGSGPDGALPADPAVVAQELFVFSLADEGRRELARVVTSDYSKAQMTVKLASMSSDLVFEQVHTAERLAAEAFAGSGIATSVTGSGRLFATLDHYLVVSQISSFTTAFITVFAVIFLVFRSWRFGTLAIVPNLFPVLAVFGVMGWLDISLNVATVMLASVALGIVDDDTIHFISRYRKETREGRTTDEAIMAATAHEGRAALTTTLVTSCGFAVLAMSAYRPSAWFGALLALTMVIAFLAEVFILPASIKMLPKLFGAERVHRTSRSKAGPPR